MQTTVNGLSVHKFGNPEHQPIVFIHGFPFDYSMWLEQIEALKGDYYCISYDIRGLGQSVVGDGQFTLEMYVDDLMEIIDSLALKKPVLCGLSMGGYITLRAAEREQDKFKALILCDTRAEADGNEGKLKRAATIKQINKGETLQFIENFVSGLFADLTKEEDPELYENIMETCKKSDPVGVKGATIAIMSRTDTTASLEKLELPVLIMAGAFDALTPPYVMKDMASKIKNSEFAAIPHAGHLAPLENPECVNDLIKDFLKRHQ